MKNYRSVEHTIRDVMEGLPPANLLGTENDQNDQIAVGSYMSKAFDMSPDAQKLYANLPMDTDADAAELAAVYLDKLFGMHKHAVNAKHVGTHELKIAKEYAEIIRKAGEDMKQSKKINQIVDDHLNHLETLAKDHSPHISPDEFVHPADDPRFHGVPKGYKPDVAGGPQGDRDQDNAKDYLIKRYKAAQRKIKIIDVD